jgi:hypothetical protein
MELVIKAWTTTFHTYEAHNLQSIDHTCLVITEQAAFLTISRFTLPSLSHQPQPVPTYNLHCIQQPDSHDDSAMLQPTGKTFNRQHATRLNTMQVL